MKEKSFTKIAARLFGLCGDYCHAIKEISPIKLFISNILVGRNASMLLGDILKTYAEYERMFDED